MFYVYLLGSLLFFKFLTKKFNLEKLIGTDRSFMMCTQCALWDKFKVMSALKIKATQKLGTFLGHLLSRKLLSATMLKTIDFRFALLRHYDVITKF